ncbi:S8 family serine peptidase [Actinokineospora globicatena]|uniref:S8 family serine peptidase n=1 Tax=Actinokineospora globicatena TaxID=103729 RepID=UPI00249FAB6A|nr:S8 family serine peptidase [Actinokineospora globicatena]MCP2304536.1 Serine protease, subtilisin family [Actinokineospora globicatena]GLW78095.1 peptidase [Actinokineospora globicatena]GLW85239.1 peptidase [Actinokineospora globicatena]
MRGHKRGFLAGVAVLVASVGVAVPASAAPQAPRSDGAASRFQVTLVTGHQVEAVRDAGGRWRVGLAPSGPITRYSTFGKQRGNTTDVYLVPQGAAALVQAGVVDRELFNVTGLIRQGFDDKRSKTVPLLVEYGQGVAAAAPRGAAVERALPGLGFAAVAEDKANANQFWSSVAGSTTALSGGPRKIWLNARFTANLDQSVPQIGAPTAWQAGHTGKGVTVAVLDTGYDTGHPDLAGKVTKSKDFSGKGTVQDGHGHGTHVASTVAGSGAASGGKFKGVAPDASLAVGKVLDDGGSGSLDDILAGMEWASGEAGAKVVNLSLGSYPTDGTDPASQVVNTLTARNGTLFVIAAGNFGSDEAVSSPASADAALAVGSITKGNELSDFSSRGPRVGDGAVKPEIAAPGSDIVAARAKDTDLGDNVDANYARLSGTSMATPHTAGAAALLAQQHPDWQAPALKAALVGTAAAVGDNGVNAVGGGRVDLARATSQAVRADQATVNGYLRWPSTTVEQRKVTYTNDSAAPVTLKLDVTLRDKAGAAAPAKLAKLSATTVTVPAKGKADVTLALTPRSGTPGLYSGVLSATTADNAVKVRTPVAVHDEAEHYDLTVNAKDRTGAATTTGIVNAVNLDTGAWAYGAPGEKLRLPPGNYALGGAIETPRPGQLPSSTLFTNPAFKLGKANKTVTFDARDGKRVAISTDQPDARGGVWTTRLQYKVKSVPYPYGQMWGFDPRFNEVYAFSTRGVTSPGFGYADNVHLAQPDLELFGEGSQSFETAAGWLRGSATPVLDDRVPTAHGGAGTPEDLAKIDARGKFVVLELSGDLTYEEVYARIAAVKQAGGKYVGVLPVESSALMALADDEEPLAALPTVRLYEEPGKRFASAVKAGGLNARFVTRAFSKHRYELSYPSAGKIPTNLTHHEKTANLAAVRMAYYEGTEAEPPISSAWVEALDDEIGTQWGLPTVPKAERVEYYTPGKWRLTVGSWWAIGGDGEQRLTLERGKTYSAEWGASVLAPAFPGKTTNDLGADHPWVWRKSGLLDVTVPFFTDPAGHTRGADYWMNTDSGSTALYADGRPIGTQNSPGRGVFVLPDNANKYRLTTDITRDQPWWPNSTKITADWTFQLPRAADAPAPLLSVGYRPKVSLANTTPGGGEFTFPVTVARQDATPTITTLTVDISYDDGATWTPTRLTRDGASWQATVTHPPTGFASLRAKATDTAGNTVDQTVTRAYRIG